MVSSLRRPASEPRVGELSLPQGAGTDRAARSAGPRRALAWNLKNQGADLTTRSRELYEGRMAGVVRATRRHCSVGRGWRRPQPQSRPGVRVARPRPAEIAPNSPSILLSRAIVHGRNRDYPRAFGGARQPRRNQSGESEARRQRAARKAACSTRSSAMTTFDAFVEGKRCTASAAAWCIARSGPTVDAASHGFFTRTECTACLAPRCARTSRSRSSFSGVPSLGDDARRADIVGPSSDLGR